MEDSDFYQPCEICGRKTPARSVRRLRNGKEVFTTQRACSQVCETKLHDKEEKMLEQNILDKDDYRVNIQKKEEETLMRTLEELRRRRIDNE